MPPDVKIYTWSQFVAAVMGLLPVDSKRLGPVQPYIANILRLAVIELQNLIPAYRKYHETLYQASDFIGEGFASRTSLPPQARVRDAFLVYYERNREGQAQPSCRRFQLADFPWANRMQLVNSRIALNENEGKICFDPQATSFYVYPCVRDTQNVSVFWEGLKINFQDNELTPFDEQMTLVVADYCKMLISRTIDKDLALAESYETSYKAGRSLLFLQLKDRGETNE